ncbi:MAG: MarR family transcriptional regulator [Armatimonadota bacterium]
MSDSDIIQQANELASLISKLIRTLYTLETGDMTGGLPIAQLRACGTLLEKPRTISCLSKELGISASAGTQLADRLEKAGLAERFAEQGDNRLKHLRLTDHGRQMISARREKRVEHIAKALNELSSEDRERVIYFIMKLYQAGKSTKEKPPVEDSLAAVVTSLD